MADPEDIERDHAPNTKNQHYVWRHYLNAWAETGSFCCYRQAEEKMLSTQPKAVASETYFHELQYLTAADRKFLETFIGDKGDDRLRRLNLDYIELTLVLCAI
jgi:Protein of unknown function (DUF4238)